MIDRFDHFFAIDWSGAAGEFHRGIAVATCDSAGGAPVLCQPPGRRWSRQGILEFLVDGLPQSSLVGLDLGISLPFADCGAFFPGWDESPPDAESLWAMVDAICATDPYLVATSFADHERASAYFRRHGGRQGEHFHAPGATHGRGRFRVTEIAQAERQQCRPYSNFNLVGAAQVGKSSLTGMRVLHRLRGRLPIWPVDPLPPAGSVVVEIYTAIAAIDAGRRVGRTKMRSLAQLSTALAALSCPVVPGAGPIDDHSADALLTSAWLRVNAGRADLWAPVGLTEAIARTEGWTFGVD